MKIFRYLAAALMLIGGLSFAYVVLCGAGALDPMDEGDARFIEQVAQCAVVLGVGAIIWVLSKLVASHDSSKA